MQKAEDPHHGGRGEWCVVDNKLYHKNKNEEEWQEVKRVSFTPERIIMIANLLEKSESYDA